MLRTLFPRAHRKFLSLPLLGPIIDGFDDWLAGNGFTRASRKFCIRMLRHVDEDLRLRRVDKVAELSHSVLHDCWRSFMKSLPCHAGTVWPQTATVLRSFCKQRNLDLRSESCVFLNHREQPISRFGIRYILARCLGLACEDAPNLRKKRLHPHSMRHSMVVALIKSGVDLSTISHLLGHASPTTTNRYAKVDLEMKRQAIAKVRPVPRQSRKPWSKDRTILDWLESL